MTYEAVLDRAVPAADGIELRIQLGIALIDEALGTYSGRSIVAAHDVVNELLDLRSALTAEFQSA